MFERREFLLLARLDAASLDRWIEAGWLLPREAGPEFSEIDLARAHLIQDMREAMGLNDEGITVALGLLDQLHGLRHALRQMSTALQTAPEPVRREMRAWLRDANEAPPATG